MIAWIDVVALTLAFPGVEQNRSFGRPTLTIRNRLIASAGHSDTHFIMSAEVDEIAAMIDASPIMYFQTDQYRGWPFIQVRYHEADPAIIAAHIKCVWRRFASRAQRAALAA